MDVLETDYLVVGAGTSGMAFADALCAGSDATVLLVDRRPAPGGHWNDAYPFVRLHVPAAYYGVHSTRLGTDAVDSDGPNAGWYELADAPSICAYYARVLDDVLLPTGRVRFLGGHEVRGDVVHDLATGRQQQVVVRRRVVDARYLEGDVPATHVPSFAVAEGVRCVPVNALAEPEPADRYVVLGGGKTSIDACLHLLRSGVEPARITWVRPRDMWLLDRAAMQPLTQVGALLEGVSLDLEAVDGATSLRDLVHRLEERGRLLRIDPDVEPTMYKCATVSRAELDLLRSIHDVVRLGRVRRIDEDAVVLEHGTVPTGPSCLHVDCTATGTPSTEPRPVFQPGRITVQPVRSCSPCLNAALIGHLEATRSDDEDRNRLAPVNPYPDAPVDWLRGLVVTMDTAQAWASDPELAAWLESSRLDQMRGLGAVADEPRTVAAFARLGEHLEAGMTNARRLLAEVPQQRSTPSRSLTRPG